VALDQLEDLVHDSRLVGFQARQPAVYRVRLGPAGDHQPRIGRTGAAGHARRGQPNLAFTIAFCASARHNLASSTGCDPSSRTNTPVQRPDRICAALFADRRRPGLAIRAEPKSNVEFIPGLNNCLIRSLNRLCQSEKTVASAYTDFYRLLIELRNQGLRGTIQHLAIQQHQ